MTRFNLREFIIRTKSKISVTVIIITFLAIIFAMHGGTPIEHGDNLAPKAKHTVRNFGDPKFFNYPALMIYMNAFVYIVYEMVLKVFPYQLSRTLDKWPYRDIPGHLLTILFSIIGALSVYGICFILTKSRLYSTIGSLLLITSPLWNANSHFNTVDIPLSALCVLTVFILVYILEKKKEITVHNIVALGILIGFTASAKYNGALIATAVSAALLFRIKPFLHGLKLLAICGLCAIATFLLINPFILINFHTFMHDFLFELNHVATGHPGFTVSAFHHHLSKSLYLGWNFGPILLSGAGFILVLVNKKLKIYTKLAIFVFPILYLMILLRTKLAFQRYALPMIPFLAVLAAYAVFIIGQYIKNRHNRYQRCLIIMILSVVILMVLGVNTYQSLRHNIVLQKTDTRIILGDIFFENSKELIGSKIGAGNYCMNFLGVSAKKKIMSWVRNSEANIPSDYDIIVIDSFTHDRYISDKNMQLQIDFSKLSSGRLITISPYTQKKTAIPFSPKSMYSPYYPDLPFRIKPGPYIEIYFADPQLAQTFSQILTRKGIDNTPSDIKRGYYYGMFSKEGSGAGEKSLSDKTKKINQRFFELFKKRKSGKL